MSDALGLFLNDLMVTSGRQAIQISIISDNATKMHLPQVDGGTRRAPGRSISTPLHLMSRWESQSKFDCNSMDNPSAGLSPIQSIEKKCRWENMPDVRDRLRSMGPLARPQRQISEDTSQDDKRRTSSSRRKTSDSTLSDKLITQKAAAFGVCGKEANGVTSLPGSFRILPC
jgi:hypothetical protein